MPTYDYRKPHNVAQLYDELIAAIPACAPVPISDDRINNPDDPAQPGDREARCQVEGRRSDGRIRITVADAVRKADLDAVVAAHVADPTYGVEPTLTEADLLAMTDVELRRFLAKRLLGRRG